MDNIWIYVYSIVCTPVLYVIYRLVRYFIHIFRCTRALKQFPSPDYHWFYGHNATFSGFNDDGLAEIATFCEKMPRYFAMFFGPLRPMLVLVHPETIETITKTAEPKAMYDGGAYTLLRPWLGDGLLTSQGDKYTRTRRLVMNAFNSDVLSNYISVYNTCADTLLQKIQSKITSCTNGFSTSHPDTPISMDIFPLLRLCTLNIILKCTFSNNEDVQGRGDSAAYVKTVTSLIRLLLDRLTKPVLAWDALYWRTDEGKLFHCYATHSHHMARHVIAQRRAAIETHGASVHEGRYKDVLDALLEARDEAGPGLSDAEIQDEVSTFLFTGHETTATAMSWLLYNLARHEQYQTRVHQELDLLFADRSKVKKFKVKYSDLSKMPYLTMCLKESMRLHPPVPFISRETTKPTRFDEKQVPAGTTININIYALHHNSSIWGDNHMEFNPERFSPGETKERHSHAFLPFSAGPRSCIGQHFAMDEVKTVLARVLYEYRVSVDNKHNVHIVPDVTLRPKHGIKLHFHRR